VRARVRVQEADACVHGRAHARSPENVCLPMWNKLIRRDAVQSERSDTDFGDKASSAATEPAASAGERLTRSPAATSDESSVTTEPTARNLSDATKARESPGLPLNNSVTAQVDASNATVSGAGEAAQHPGGVTGVVATSVMCAYAFSVLERELRTRGRLSTDDDPFREALPPDSDAYGLFITWKILADRGHLRTTTDSVWQLRGCIGTLTPTGLHDALRSYAVTAALHDRRFAPIRIEELPRLLCVVSLLSDFTERDSVWDWEPGVHGLIVEVEPQSQQRRFAWRRFTRPRTSRYSATYLPEVPLELKWSKYETICSLIRKSGYLGDVPATETDSWWSECVFLTTYRSTKAELRYDEYRAMLIHRLN